MSDKKIPGVLFHRGRFAIVWNYIALGDDCPIAHFGFVLRNSDPAKMAHRLTIGLPAKGREFFDVIANRTWVPNQGWVSRL
jgi:hypothetical protein